MQAAGNDEPIPFNRVGDGSRIGVDRAQVAEGLPPLRPAAGRLMDLRMMRSALVSAALIFGGLLRRFGAVRFGIRAIREEAQRGLMHPDSDAIGCRPDLLITNDGPVESRFLGPAAEVNPCGDAARRRVVLYPAADFRVVKALQDETPKEAALAE